MNIKKFVAITIIIIASLSMASCGENSDADSLPIESQTPVAVAPLTDKQAEDLYKAAVRVWGWYATNGLAVDESDTKEYNGYRYVRVKDNEIKTLTDLESSVHSVFGDDIAKQRLSDTMKFRDIDGNLYMLFSDGGSLVGKEIKSGEVLPESDSKMIYRITANIIEDKGDSFKATSEEVYDIIFEYIDGTWKCTQFEYIPVV